MSNDKAPQELTEEQRRYYLIFDELSKLNATEQISSVSLDEIEEIQQIARTIADATEDPPHFATST